MRRPKPDSRMDASRHTSSVCADMRVGSESSLTDDGATPHARLHVRLTTAARLLRHRDTLVRPHAIPKTSSIAAHCDDTCQPKTAQFQWFWRCVQRSQPHRSDATRRRIAIACVVSKSMHRHVLAAIRTWHLSCRFTQRSHFSAFFQRFPIGGTRHMPYISPCRRGRHDPTTNRSRNRKSWQRPRRRLPRKRQRRK